MTRGTISAEASLALVRRIAEATQAASRPVRLMEVCGTHTMAIFRSGVRSILPEGPELVSGPGCSVCVTPPGYMDRAVAISRLPGVTVATYGDMIRVPGSAGRTRGTRAYLEAGPPGRRHPGGGDAGNMRERRRFLLQRPNEVLH
jgi:hydrogenase expression/formation protein HypD